MVETAKRVEKEEQTVEQIYLSSARKLRTGLPKFVIFLGAAFLIWLFGSLLLIPLGHGTFIFDIEASQIINLIIIAAVLVLIFTCFKEIGDVANACAGFVTYYVSKEKKRIGAIRLGKLESTFRSFAYVILVSFLFIMFKPILDQIHTALAGIAIIIISVWVIIALYSVVMAMSSEIEETASAFAEKVEKQINSKRRKRKK